MTELNIGQYSLSQYEKFSMSSNDSFMEKTSILGRRFVNLIKTGRYVSNRTLSNELRQQMIKFDLKPLLGESNNRLNLIHRIDAILNRLLLDSEHHLAKGIWTKKTAFLRLRNKNKDVMSKQFLELISRENPSGKKFMTKKTEGSPDYLDCKVLKGYLEGEFEYEVAANPAEWNFPKKLLNAGLAGKLGYHLLLRLPGKRIVEWTPDPSPWETKGKSVKRMAKGKVLEEMWNKHLTLLPKYNSWKSTISPVEGMRKYRPGKNDCYSYVNRILVETDQAPIPSGLNRYSKGSIAAILSGFLMKFYGRDPGEEGINAIGKKKVKVNVKALRNKQKFKHEATKKTQREKGIKK